MPEVNVAVTASVPKSVVAILKGKWLPVASAVYIAFVLWLIVPIVLRGPVPTARLNDNNFNLEIRRTPDERAQGLSGREKLNTDDGMLFIFEKSAKHCFWMKDMLFSIDILWFDENSRLVHQAEHVSPSSFPHSFCPTSAATYVLEVRAGTAQRLGLKLGDELILSNL